MLLRVSCAPVAREQIRVVFPFLFVFRDPAEDILEPCPFIHSAGLTGGEERVDHRGSLGRFVVPTEQIVLPSDGKGRLLFSTMLSSIL